MGFWPMLVGNMFGAEGTEGSVVYLFFSPKAVHVVDVQSVSCLVSWGFVGLTGASQSSLPLTSALQTLSVPIELPVEMKWNGCLGAGGSS